MVLKREREKSPSKKKKKEKEEVRGTDFCRLEDIYEVQ